MAVCGGGHVWSSIALTLLHWTDLWILPCSATVLLATCSCCRCIFMLHYFFHAHAIWHVGLPHL